MKNDNNAKLCIIYTLYCAQSNSSASFRVGQKWPPHLGWEGQVKSGFRKTTFFKSQNQKNYFSSNPYLFSRRTKIGSFHSLHRQFQSVSDRLPRFSRARFFLLIVFENKLLPSCEDLKVFLPRITFFPFVRWWKNFWVWSDLCCIGIGEIFSFNLTTTPNISP